MNALLNFYAALLTDKQMNYTELYYADDYSLAEIAEEFASVRLSMIISREKVLEDYEMKSCTCIRTTLSGSQIFDQILERYP